MKSFKFQFVFWLFVHFFAEIGAQTIRFYIDAKSQNKDPPDGSISKPFTDLISCFQSTNDPGSVYKISLLSNITIQNPIFLDNRQICLTKEENVQGSIFMSFESKGSIKLNSCQIFNISNISICFQKDYTSLFLISFLSGTFLTLKNVDIDGQETSSTNSAIFLGEESGLNILSCKFKNLIINGGTLIKISGLHEQNNTEINDSVFYKINQKISANSVDLILVNKLDSSFFLRNCTFSSNNASNSLVSVLNSKKLITVQDSLISENWVVYSAVNLENSLSVLIVASTIQKMNKQNGYNLTDGGCALFLRNVVDILLFKFVLQDSYSNITAVGVKIIDDSRLNSIMGSPSKQTVQINESSFLRNYVFFEKLNQIGCALLVSSDASLIIENSTFSQNLMNSTDSSKYKAGSPCLNSLSTKNDVNIIFSHFLENKSRFLGNCLMVYGLSLFINSSNFKNNYPIVSAYTWQKYISYLGAPRSIMVSHEEIGGSLFSLSNKVSITKSTFSGSGGYNGGAIFFTVNSEGDGSLFLRMQEVFFDKNEGGINGGHLFVYSTMKTMDAFINNSYFASGDADQGGVMGVYYKCKQCYFTINSSIFTMNVATFGAAIDFANEDGYFFVNNSLFMNQTALNPKISLGSGSVFRFGANLKAYLASFNNTYLNNVGASRGEFSVKIVKYYESYSTHLYAQAMEGAVSTIIMFGSLEFNNCIFMKTSANNNGGCFHMIESAVLKIKSSYFEGCIAKRNGAVVIGMEKIVILMENTSFYYNEAYTGAIFIGQENFGNTSRVDFVNCTAVNNKAVGELFSFSDTKFYMDNCVIMSQSASVILSVTSLVRINRSSFLNISCISVREGCVLSVQDNTLLVIDNSNLTNISSKVSGGGFYSENSTLIINNIWVNQAITEIYGSVISTFVSYLLINNSYFVEYGANAFYLKNSTIFLDNSFFHIKSRNSATVYSNSNPFGSIYIQSPNGSCFLTKTSFIGNLYAKSGGAIYIYNDDIEDENIVPTIVIRTCNFHLNSVSALGGAIYNWRQNLFIESCLFDTNYADNGGGIYLDSNNENSTRGFMIKNSEFYDNQAQNDGGAIKWLGKRPELTELIFSEKRPNKAVYGGNIAAFPLRFKLTVNRIIDDNSIKLIQPWYTSDDDGDDWLILDNVVSGNPIEYELHFEVIDCYNQTVTTLNSGAVELDFLEKEYLEKMGYANWNRSGYSHLKHSSSIVSGKASFYEITLVARPPADIIVKAYSSEIDTFFSTTLGNIAKLKSIINIKNTFNILIQMKVRPCINGEIYFEETNSCYLCPEGKFTLKGPYEAGDCHVCLPNVICKGGEKLELKKGYWRSSNRSQIIHQCTRNKEFCLGGYNSICSTGYSGPLCGGCSTSEPKKFSRISNFCVECLDKSLNQLRFAFAFIGFFIIMGLLVFSAIRDASKLDKDNQLSMKKCLSIYLKIFMNYIQINSIISAMELKWPDYMKNYTTLQTNTGNIPSQIISIECLIFELNLKTHPVYFRAVAATLLPFLLIVIFQGILAIVWIYKKQNQFTNMVINFHVVSIFLQPTVLQELTDIITCQEVDPGRFYMTKEMNIECYTSEHKQWALCLVFPMLTYWILLYPMGCLLYLNRHQAMLSELNIRRKLGFYLNGYKKKFYFWEFLVMYRKVLVLFLSSILDIPVLVKVTCLLALNTVFFYLTINYKPFLMRDLNDMERNSNLAALCIGYFGLMYLAIDNEFAKGLIFLFLILVNINFLINWTKSVLVIIFSSQMERLYRMCPGLMDKLFSLADALSNLNVGRNLSSQSTKKNTISPKNYRTIFIGSFNSQTPK